MKKLFITLSFLLSTLLVSAQHTIFVLVDVSRSISQAQLSDAREALYQVLTGSDLSKAKVVYGQQQDLAGFQVSSGDTISVSKFGDLQPTLAIKPKFVEIKNVTADVDRALNTIQWVPTDRLTYFALAKAKIAEYAKNNGISNYKLYIISDYIQDNFGHNGKPHYPDDYSRNLAEGYNTPLHQVAEAPSTKLKFDTDADFALSFSPAVDVKNYFPPQKNGGAVNQTPTVAPIIDHSITLTSFANGKKDRPKQTNANSFTVSWACNCQAGTTFNVILSETVDGGYKEQKRNLASNSVNFTDVPSGVFKVSVTAENARSAITFVETPGGGSGWVVFLLIFAAIIGVGIYMWNKKRAEKVDNTPSGTTKDIFSTRGSGGTNNSQGNTQSNSDYF